MKTKAKRGKKMHKGKWKLTSPGGLAFTGTLRANIHVHKGERVAIFVMRKTNAQS